MYCSGPPATAPPGTTELTALPTSCDVAMSVQCRLDVEMPTRSQTEAKLSSSRIAIATNQPGLICESSSYEPNTFTTAGQTK